MMAQKGKERQANYRNRRSTAGDNGERRINTWVSTAATLALKRLAHRYGVTSREVLERLILEADETIVKTIDPETAAWNTYFKVTQ
jgi:hypothetical protein